MTKTATDSDEEPNDEFKHKYVGGNPATGTFPGSTIWTNTSPPFYPTPPVPPATATFPTPLPALESDSELKEENEQLSRRVARLEETQSQYRALISTLLDVIDGLVE